MLFLGWPRVVPQCLQGQRTPSLAQQPGVHSAWPAPLAGAGRGLALGVCGGFQVGNPRMSMCRQPKQEHHRPNTTSVSEHTRRNACSPCDAGVHARVPWVRDTAASSSHWLQESACVSTENFDISFFHGFWP